MNSDWGGSPLIKEEVSDEKEDAADDRRWPGSSRATRGYGGERRVR